MESHNADQAQHISSIFAMAPPVSGFDTHRDEGERRTNINKKARAEAAQSRRKMGQAELRIQYQIEAAAE